MQKSFNPVSQTEDRAVIIAIVVLVAFYGVVSSLI
ncbi:hypothetical protein Ga0123462_1067 [Mariprofundus ferrinatatus]|uniref:Uncharacterized protein n=1 Tax=Mariprofundus ferrinatatus TaxID=1921087 RepID=A0A2K8LAG0_9PROT|nr:hypothetical protein Ga0123462_1067 [Mariprofundus ferrinatatus]